MEQNENGSEDSFIHFRVFRKWEEEPLGRRQVGVPHRATIPTRTIRPCLQETEPELTARAWLHSTRSWDDVMIGSRGSINLNVDFTLYPLSESSSFE